MSLTTAQLQALKADIAANTAVLPAGDQFAGQQIKNLTVGSSDAAFSIANWYNGFASPTFFGDYSSVPLKDVKNAITFKNYTPADPIPTDTALNVAIWQARALLCQCYQINVNNILLASDSVDATKSSIVSGLKDCTQNVPAGVGGANVSGGWSNIQKILCRAGRWIEKLFADTSGGNGGTNTTAATFTFEGTISVDDVLNAWNS